MAETPADVSLVASDIRASASRIDAGDAVRFVATTRRDNEAFRFSGRYVVYTSALGYWTTETRSLLRQGSGTWWIGNLTPSGATLALAGDTLTVTPSKAGLLRVRVDYGRASTTGRVERRSRPQDVTICPCVELEVEPIESHLWRVTATVTNADGEASDVAGEFQADGGEWKSCGTRSAYWRTSTSTPRGPYYGNMLAFVTAAATGVGNADVYNYVRRRAAAARLCGRVRLRHLQRDSDGAWRRGEGFRG